MVNVLVFGVSVVLVGLAAYLFSDRKRVKLQAELESVAAQLTTEKAHSQAALADFGRVTHELSAIKQNIIEQKAELGNVQQRLSEAKDLLNRREGELARLQTEQISLRDQNSKFEAMDSNLREQIDDLNRQAKMETERHAQEMKGFRVEADKVKEELLGFKNAEAQRIQDYEHKVERMALTMATFEAERQRLKDESKAAEEKQMAEMRMQWQKHEDAVETKLRGLCEKLQIHYLEANEVKFPGKPDNAIAVMDGVVIFDAKSPANEDLSNFPKYIKEQAQNLKKYAKHSEVKRDLYLVVPTNAIETVAETVMNMGDYRVYVITFDALEPILFAMKRIEEFSLADKLSPEDREKIVAYIGKMTHGLKRKIQIDQHFTREFLDLLLQERTLPDDIKKEVQEADKATKMNPPIAKRNKAILSEDLAQDAEEIQGRIVGQGVDRVRAAQVAEDGSGQKVS